jgi:hypothetical protein
MATIALRVSTTDHQRRVLTGGHCYLVLSDPTITVHDLLDEKMRAELRKARAGGQHVSSIESLLGHPVSNVFGPLDQQLACAEIVNRFMHGDILLSVDGTIVDAIDHVIQLRRGIEILFIIPARVEQTA